MRAKVMLVEDPGLSDWLLKLAETPSEHFLHALSVAALKATDEDYCTIRPSLMELKRKYSCSESRGKSDASAIASHKGTAKSGETAIGGRADGTEPFTPSLPLFPLHVTPNDLLT